MTLLASREEMSSSSCSRNCIPQLRLDPARTPYQLHRENARATFSPTLRSREKKMEKVIHRPLPVLQWRPFSRVPNSTAWHWTGLTRVQLPIARTHRAHKVGCFIV